MNFKRVDPLRREGVPLGDYRRRLTQECDELRADLTDIDAQLALLAQRRQRVATELRAKERTLFPNVGRFRGRQPGPLGEDQLCPVRGDAVKLWGRRLRKVCIGVLRSTGALPLPALHAMLHRLGYEVDSRHHVKVLADAMAYEVDQGRAQRIARGVYCAVGEARPHPQSEWRPDLLGESA